MEIIYLNIGGVKYETTKGTLCNSEFFKTMLEGRIPTTIDKNGYYFIDRDGDLFRPILSFLRTGILITNDFNENQIRTEAQFYLIDLNASHDLLMFKANEKAIEYRIHEDGVYGCTTDEWDIMYFNMFGCSTSCYRFDRGSQPAKHDITIKDDVVVLNNQYTICPLPNGLLCVDRYFGSRKEYHFFQSVKPLSGDIYMLKGLSGDFYNFSLRIVDDEISLWEDLRGHQLWVAKLELKEEKGRFQATCQNVHIEEQDSYRQWHRKEVKTFFCMFAGSFAYVQIEDLEEELELSFVGYKTTSKNKFYS